MFQSNSAANLPSGFRLHSKRIISTDGDDIRVSVLLPLNVVEQLAQEAQERLAQEIAEHQRRQQELDQRSRLSRLANEDAAARPVGLGPRWSTAPSRNASPTIPEVCPPQPKHTVAVFDWAAAALRFRELESRPSSGDREVIKRDLQHFAKALEQGPWRLVPKPSTWKKALNALAAEMPNFAPVLTFIRQRLALADLSSVALQPPPILLLGSPGVGKTYFTERLADAMRTVVFRQSFDNAQSNSVLRGSERYWGNTSTGALWNLIVQGTHANPVILLDELDKGTEGSGQYRPADSLLTLLEPVTSARVKDVSVDFEFDASHAWFIATGNDAHRLSAPLRSRFVEFVIEPPDIDGRLILAHGVFQATLKRLVPSKRKRARFRPPTDLQICRLAWLTPREIRMASERLLGAAALAGRWHLEDADMDVALARPAVPQDTPRRGGDDPDALAIVIVGRPS